MEKTCVSLCQSLHPWNETSAAEKWHEIFFFTPLTNHKVIITTVPSEDFVYNTKHQHISMKELTREQHSVELVTINSEKHSVPRTKNLTKYKLMSGYSSKTLFYSLLCLMICKKQRGVIVYGMIWPSPDVEDPNEDTWRQFYVLGDNFKHEI